MMIINGCKFWGVIFLVHTIHFAVTLAQPMHIVHCMFLPISSYYHVLSYIVIYMYTPIFYMCKYIHVHVHVHVCINALETIIIISMSSQPVNLHHMCQLAFLVTEMGYTPSIIL